MIREKLYHISKIGNFEARILWRSWLFRVFAILILSVLLLFNLFAVLHVAGGTGWQGRFAPGNITYMNFFLFTIVQVVIASFLSADFLGRERKMDTTEVFYTRPVSNLEYVLGKTWGALMVFSGINILVSLLSAVTTLLSPDVPFAVTPLFFHFFVSSVPALFFILGFSFLLMVLLRNQAVTFVLVLGFGAIVLFYLENKHWGVWDFMAFYLPVQYSGFTGFSNLPSLLLQRGTFVLLGLLGIFLTAYTLPRLPGAKRKATYLLVLSALALTGAAFFVFLTLSTGMRGERLRERIRQQEGRLPERALAHIDSCRLIVRHLGEEMETEATLKLSRLQGDSLYLALNPGFRVNEVFIDEKRVDFHRDLGLLVLAYDQGAAKADSSLHCRIKYCGAPDQQAIYPYVEESSRQMLNRYDILVAGKEYAFVQPDFVLLTREAGWYPVVAWRHYRKQAPFTAYSLTYSSDRNMPVFSQGAAQYSDGHTHFVNDEPLNALSLLSGSYAVDSLTVDGINYQLGLHLDNGLIRNNFDQIGDTLPVLIGALKDQYERRLKVKYPFKRLKIMEVPAHFYSYLQAWTSATDHTHPEFILLPEYGGVTWFLNPDRIRNDLEKEFKQRGEEGNEKELQARMFVLMAANAFIYPDGYIYQQGQHYKVGLPRWNRAQVFPLYFHYVYQIEEEPWPIFQIMLEEALRTKAQRGHINSWGSAHNQYAGLMALRKKTLGQWLSQGTAEDTITQILHLRGIHFFTEFSALSEEGDFSEEMGTAFNNYKFRTSQPADWLEHVKLSIDPFKRYQSIQQDAALPAFEFGWAQTQEVAAGDKNKYLVAIHLSNLGPVDGLVETKTDFLDLSVRNYQSHSQWTYQRMNDEENVDSRLHLIPAYSKVRIDMLFDELPRNTTVYTSVAQNIPPQNTFYFEHFEKTAASLPIEGVHFLDSAKTRNTVPNEIIVDNEDPGFSIASLTEVRTLKEWLLKRERAQAKEYDSFYAWDPKGVWTYNLGENYHGYLLKSAVLKSSGNGNDLARWEASLPEEGIYEVQAFIPYGLQLGWQHRNARGGFRYKIRHANGVDEVETLPINDHRGWVVLGRYFFRKGEAVIELSDKSGFPYVAADAVKWIKTK